MAPILKENGSIESHSTTIVVTSIFATASVCTMLILAMMNCGCCGGKDKKSGEGGDVKGPEGDGGGKATEVSQKKKEVSKAADYVVLGEVSLRKDDKKPTEFANARDPNYKSLMGVDDKFEPSAKKSPSVKK